MLDYKSTKSVNPDTGISDGVQPGREVAPGAPTQPNGKYWSRQKIQGRFGIWAKQPK